MGKIALIELKIIHLKQEFCFFIVQRFFSKFDLGLQHLIMRFLYLCEWREEVYFKSIFSLRV